MDFVFVHQVGFLHEWFIKHVYLLVQLSGGPVDGLVEALQSLGVSEGVRLLRDSQPREDKQSTGTGSHSDRETSHFWHNTKSFISRLWIKHFSFLPDSKEDSGFGSQSIEEEMGNPAVANHWLSGSILWGQLGTLFNWFFRCELVDCSSSQSGNAAQHGRNWKGSFWGQKLSLVLHNSKTTWNQLL